MSPRPFVSGGPLDTRLRASLTAVALCGAPLSLGAWAVLGPRAAFSVAIGAAIAVGNLWALARIVTALLAGNGDHALPSTAGAWSLLALLKMFGLFAVVWLLMRWAAVSPMAMLVGFGALPIGIAIGSLVSDRGDVAHR
jgi:ATP synthase I chain